MKKMMLPRKVVVACLIKWSIFSKERIQREEPHPSGTYIESLGPSLGRIIIFIIMEYISNNYAILNFFVQKFGGNSKIDEYSK